MSLTTNSNKPMTALLLLKRMDCDNGVTSYCETIMQGIKDAGDRVVMVTGPIAVTPATQKRLDNMQRLADEWLKIPNIGKPAAVFQSCRVILEVIRRQNVDVIYSQGFSTLPLAKLLSLRSGKPIISCFHGGAASHRGKEGSFKERAYYQSSATLFSAKQFISFSHETTRFLIKVCGIKPSSIVRIPHGIDIQYFRPPAELERTEIRTAFDIPEHSLVCVLPGWVSEDKGHRLVVEAVRSLRQSNPEIGIVCLFAGSTEQGAAIMEDALIDESDLRAFRFLGFLSKQQIREAFWAADIVLLPSLIEGFAIAIAEAMACGCIPIRTPAAGCADQVIDNVTGFVIPFKDSSALANKIRLLDDPEKRHAMRQAAQAHAVAHFDKDQMIARTIEVFRNSDATAGPGAGAVNSQYAPS